MHLQPAPKNSLRLTLNPEKRMKIEPTCRYGHGALIEIARSPDEHYWGFIGASLVPFRVEMSVDTPLEDTEVSGRIYTVSLFRCPSCGYLEVFDDEPSND